MTGNDDDAVLRVERIAKVFAGQIALDDVHLRLVPGRIHALVGQNGSGKSTLIKVLAGYHIPEPGAIGVLDGNAYPFGLGAAVYRAGVRFIHQDLDLVENLSIVDNLALSRGYRSRFWVSLRRESKVAATMLSRFGLEVDPLTPIRDLSPVERTLVAITRAIGGENGDTKTVLVLDEPTAALPQPEIERLFQAIRGAVALGIAVLYVSHNLDEVMELADEVSILRDGKVIAHQSISSLHPAELVNLIVGAELAQWERHPVGKDVAGKDRVPVFKANAIRGYMIGPTSFEVGEGEIVGIAGLMGSGREELASLCGGSLTATGGSVEIAGQEIRSLTPRIALASGIAYVAADRKNLSAIPSMTARENITLPRIRSKRISSWLHLGSERRDAGEWMRRTNVQPLRTERAVATFSGGNQQKIVLARALRLQPKLLVIDQPVQGVDVGNKALIFKLLVDRSAEGMGILAASSDPEDLAAICHRVLIIRRGRVVGTLSGDEVTAARITSQISLGEKLLASHTASVLTDSVAD